MSIRDRLSRLDTSAPGPAREPDLREDWIETAERELRVQVLRKDGGMILLREGTYPLDSDPHYPALREQGLRARGFHRLAALDPDPPLNLRKTVFIDTETTGLAGGSGTYAFLVGMGVIELDHVVVRQYLLPDFAHEWLMLEHLDATFREHAWTASFNGKTFDLPLLRTRYVLNRMDATLDDLVHVDLLHAARRLWRDRLPACDLQTLEREILGLDRGEDLPGHLIPQVYFDFIRRRDAMPMRDVLEHNFHDIVNMVLLSLRLAAIAAEPLTHLTHVADRFSFARYLVQSGHVDAGAHMLETMLADPALEHDPLYAKLCFLASLAQKKRGDGAAARRWMETLWERRHVHPRVVEELAKYYEHGDGDFGAALAVVRQGLAYLDTIRQLDPRSPALKFLPALRHREKRLIRRLARQADG